MVPTNENFNIFITSPVEAENIERIRSVGGNAVTVIYEPDLLPPTRYVADHKGVDGFFGPIRKKNVGAHILRVLMCFGVFQR